MIILEVLVCILVLVFGYTFSNRFYVFNSYDKSILSKLFFYHIIIGVFFFFFVLNFGGDAKYYWFVSHSINFTFNDVFDIVNQSKGSASGYMMLLNFIPAKLFNLSFFTGSLMYSILGYLGFVYFYAIIKENISFIYLLKRNKIFGIPIFPLLLFLPNIHFWTSGVGKDTLLFFCIALFIYAMVKIKERLMHIVLAILLSIFIRPHITIFLLVSFGFGLLFDGNLKGYVKIFLSLIFLAGVFIMFDYVMSFIQLESLDTESIDKYSQTKSASLSGARTGSAVDTSSYPFLFKVFTFLYRPLFFDASGLLGLVASFENFILLIFTLKIIFSNPIKALKKMSFVIKGLLVFFIIGSFSFALILGNLGIMLRQKTPFIICLIIFGYWVLVKIKLVKTNKRFIKKVNTFV